MYEDLSFPLNVYARLLELDGKPVEYLHFGLFATPDEDVHTAQQHSDELVFAHLPAGPARILEIGMGLGTLQQKLQEAGHRPTGLTPDRAQFAIARSRLGPDSDIHCLRFEDYRCGERFDVLLSQESAQYIDLLDLVPRAASLLAPGGRLILVDEVCLRGEPARHEALHNPEHIKYLAQCLGLELAEEEELGNRARYTTEYLRDRIERHRAAILETLDGNDEQLAELEQAIEHYICRYRDAYYGYRLLVFRKTEDPDRDIRHFFHGDRHELRWYENGRLTSGFEGRVRDIRYAGDRQRIMELDDAAFSTEGRGKEREQLAHVFLQRFTDYGKPYRFCVDFPEEPADKAVAQCSTARLIRSAWPARAGLLAHPLYRIRPLGNEDHEAVDELWEEMAENARELVIGVRDWQRIESRYLAHPRNRYTVLKICQRFNDRLVAVLVLRTEQAVCELIDFVCPFRKIPLVLRCALRYSAHHGSPELSMVASSRTTSFFPAPERQEEVRTVVRYSSCIPLSDPEGFWRKFWLTAGDHSSL